MTLSTSTPRAKQRWALLVVVVAALTLLVGGIALASHPNVATDIPSSYFTVTDEHGANDVPGQVDLTQMGRDDATAGLYKVYWSWDSHTAWTGSGQTGDACALFDTDGDTNINYVVCARVANFNANPNDVRVAPKSATETVYLFECSDKKNDRCTTPGPLASTTITAGAFSPATSNLITHTDPFAAGESYDHDTTIRLEIPGNIIPGDEVLTNVCSYPSAGNGGNNNPFDCIVSPGGGYIVVEKDAGVGVSSPNFTFDVLRGTATTPLAQRTISGTGTAAAAPVLIGTNLKVSETAIPSTWDLTTAQCKLDNGAGAVTGSFTDGASSGFVSGITVQSGKITLCKFTDRIQTGTLVVKKIVINDNGGTLGATSFSYSLDANATSTAFGTDPAFPNDALKGSSPNLSMNAGTGYSVTEPGVAGYTATLSASCSGTIAAGQTSTCTITNDDDAPSLTLVKTVTNNSGGTAAAADWTLSATASGASAPALSGTTGVSSGASFDAGTYTLAESAGPSGYTAGDWSCDWNDPNQTGDPTFTATSVTVGLGQAITCTLDNDDNAPSLTLVKVVNNDFGDTAVAADWTLSATGTGTAPTDLEGSAPVSSGSDFAADTYTLAEDGPSGYSASAWVCEWDDDTQTGSPTMPTTDSVTVGLGEAITCTITNSDEAASPEGTTVQSWVLHDTLTIVGIRAGAPGDAAAVTFTLFSDDECSIPVGAAAGETVAIANGVASTSTGFAVSDPGDYYWIASYSGDAYNTAFDTECGAEITVIQATDDR